jgi:hypothetical protein
MTAKKFNHEGHEEHEALARTPATSSGSLEHSEGALEDKNKQAYF